MEGADGAGKRRREEEDEEEEEEESVLSQMKSRQARRPHSIEIRSVGFAHQFITLKHHRNWPTALGDHPVRNRD
jgi:hypothetical protein